MWIPLAIAACASDDAPPGPGGDAGHGGTCRVEDCAPWEECRDGACLPAAGRCGDDADCPANERCSEEHWCVDESGACADVDCSGHGSCVVESGLAECHCEPGHTGAACEVCDDGHVGLDDGSCVADPCVGSPCGAHADCAANIHDGSATCTCHEGYTGDDCGECAAGFYPHGSSCVTTILFALPVFNFNGDWITLPVIGFDHDPEPGWSDVDCTNYQGLAFPYCYDQHTGTDFMLRGGFVTMDAGSTAVLAAAAGEVIEAHDGEFDRCRANILTQEVECPGYPGITPPNYVKLLHADGKQTWYWHLKKDSVLVSSGQWVDCGEPLALVGSSGYSSAPHLHFAVLTAAGEKIDPYAGPFSQPKSYWVEQDGPHGLPGAECQ